MKPFRPMLASKALLQTVRFPVYASAKIDAIRCLVVDGKAMSRSMKPLPNRYLQERIAEYDLEGLDGELAVGPPNARDVYRRSNSELMSYDGQPDFTFWAFDCLPLDDVNSKIPFHLRHQIAKHAESICPFVKQLEHRLVQSSDELVAMEEEVLGLGFEGLILRCPEGPYKQGRSTSREGWMLKLKRYEDAEAVITGFDEKMHNANEATIDERGYTKRSSHQANQRPLDTLGALVVRGVGEAFNGIEFRIGTGFDDATRQDIWKRRQQLRGRYVKYKYFDIGVKDAPRHPVFLGFRDQIDMTPTADDEVGF